MEHLGGFRNLEELHLGGNQLTGASLHVLKLLPQLTTLSLRGNQKRNTGIWTIAMTDLDLESIASLRQLKSLDLGGIRITDLGVSHLRKLTNLETLDLSGTRISSAGLHSLTALPHLRRLNLWNAKGIDDNAAPALAAMKQLAVLDLSDTAITGKTLETLANASQLRSIYLTGTRVSAAAVARLRQDRPDCRIEWVPQP
jgi:Leucine-rich repeat (LRR) protein